MSIEARLERLEKQMQFYKRLVVALALVIVGGLTMGQAQSDIVDVLQCRKLEVYNPTGSAVAVISTTFDAGGCLKIYSPEEKEGVSIYATNEGGGIVISNTERRVAILAARSNGAGFLDINSRDGSPRASISTDDSGGLFVLSNKTREKVIDLRSDIYGNGIIGVWNRKGKGRVYDSQP